MASLIISSFARFSMSVQEERAASLLTLEQKQLIMNEMCSIAERRLALVPDANNYSSFIQEEAHLKGQLDAYRYMLDRSEAEEELILAEAREQNDLN